MVAVSPGEPVRVRALRPGEGQAVAGLWRELWDAHEKWGGYAGSKDRQVYEQLAHRLDDDARVRGGQPILGRHIHLIATTGRTIAGQVEGWFEKHGIDESTPHTCEVRSLIVTRGVRASGVGRALLEQLAVSTRELARGSSSFLVAEVLEPNPAHAFYAKVGYHPHRLCRPRLDRGAILAEARTGSGARGAHRRAARRARRGDARRLARRAPPEPG